MYARFASVWGLGWALSILQHLGATALAGNIWGHLGTSGSSWEHLEYLGISGRRAAGLSFQGQGKWVANKANGLDFDSCMRVRSL